MQTVLAQIGHNLQPVLTAAILLVLLVLLVLLCGPAIRSAESVAMQNLLSYVRSVALECVKAAWGEVQSLKDPTKPGAWNETTANAIAVKVTQKILAILGGQLVVLLKLMRSSATPAQLARELMEGELVRLKLEAEQAKRPAVVNVSNIEGPTP